MVLNIDAHLNLEKYGKNGSVLKTQNATKQTYCARLVPAAGNSL